MWRFGRSLCWLLWGCLVAGVPEGAAQGTDRQPNIIFIITDDQDARSIEHMPHLQRLLVKQGTSFSNFVVTTPVCGPSRGSLLRGQYVQNHEMLSNVQPAGHYLTYHFLGREEESLPVWLQRAGYVTAFVGKYMNGYPHAPEVLSNYIPPGWTEWWAQLGGAPYFGPQFNENGRIVSYPSDQYLTDIEARMARKLVEQYAGSQPLFLYVAPITPHSGDLVNGQQTPPAPAPRHQGMFSGYQAPRLPSFNEQDVSAKPPTVRRHGPLSSATQQQVDLFYQKRLEALQSVDDLIGDLVAALEAAGALENTYFFFTSDNGFMLGEHRLTLQKSVPYEESARVPLVVRGPDITADHVEERLCANIDLAPTLLELAGAALPPDFVDGRSFVPLLQHKQPQWRNRVNLAYWLEDGSLWYKGIRGQDYKYIEWSDEAREFYDLRNDPYELDNLYDQLTPTLRSRLAEDVQQLFSCAGAVCLLAEDEAIDTEAVNLPVPLPDNLLVEAFPNPAHQELKIDLRVLQAQRLVVSVYDALGRRRAFYTERMGYSEQRTLRLDTSGWPAGTYLLRIEGRTGHITRPVVVAH